MITVLLATYNGEQYLIEQLDSLLGQTFKDFKILIRDDGSTDKTVEIINDYKIKYPEKIDVITGEPTGSACGNFFELLFAAKSSDYVMFCDQDDVWLPEKIEKTFNTMLMAETENPDVPILVHSDLLVVDKDKNVISNSFFEFQAISPERDSLNNLLVQNNVTGCTTMINNKLLQLAFKKPVNCVMHDWWLALVACLFGKTICITEPLMLYRQHGNNQVGAKNARGLGFIIQKLKNMKFTKKNYQDSFNQAKSLLDVFSENMTDDEKKTVSAFASLKDSTKFKKIAIIRRFDFRKNTLVRTIGQYFSI